MPAAAPRFFFTLRGNSMARSIVLARALWVVPPMLALAACSDMGSTRSVSLSITTKSPTAASRPAASRLNADLMVGSGPNSLTINKAQVVLADIELSPSGTCSATGEDDDCDELE